MAKSWGGTSFDDLGQGFGGVERRLTTSVTGQRFGGVAKSRGLSVVLRASGRGGGRGKFEYKVEDGQKGRQRDESRAMWVAVCLGRKKT